MTQGTVKWFNTTKGYGFISPESGGKDTFVHITALEKSGLRSINDGQRVSYDIEMGKDNKQSDVNIQLID